MNLEVMTKLDIGKAFVLGTSQGGWIATRMAVMAPGRLLGIIPLATSMDSESEHTRALGCWDATSIMTPAIQSLSSPEPTPEFALPDAMIDPEIETGLGKHCPHEERDFWGQTIRTNYLGDDGRRRLRMASINLRDRDSLLGRLADVTCPVLWMQGTEDVIYSVANAREQIERFTNSPDARLVVVQGGHHFLGASNPEEVDNELLRFV